MNCPKCGERMKIIDSRPFNDGTVRIRKYRCPVCGYEDHTDETLK